MAPDGASSFVAASRSSRYLCSSLQVREELEAQLSRFRELLGRSPTHVDGHQHVHVLPGTRLATPRSWCGGFFAWLVGGRWRLPSAPTPPSRRVSGVRRGAAGIRGPLHSAAGRTWRGQLRVARSASARLRLHRRARCPGRHRPLLSPRPAVSISLPSYIQP